MCVSHHQVCPNFVFHIKRFDAEQEEFFFRSLNNKLTVNNRSESKKIKNVVSQRYSEEWTFVAVTDPLSSLHLDVTST